MKIISFLIVVIISVNGICQGYEDEIQKIESELSELESKKRDLIQQKEELVLKDIRFKIDSFGLPKLEEDEKIIDHSAFSLVYDEKHEQAKWVVHYISPEILKGKVGRTNDFRPDPKVSSGSAVEKDYFLKFLQADSTYDYDGFGYDRGHLAPSADFSWSERALSESYFYSNMSPQRPEFNRESWARLEAQLRMYVSRNPTHGIMVVTGPILSEDLSIIKRSINKVSIPERYFKIAVDLENEKAIAFIMPNKKNEYVLSHYAVTIDSIEHVTGIDFFHQLDESQEKQLESMKDLKKWIPEIIEKEVDVLNPLYLPKGSYNSVQAKMLIGKGEKTVCGTVVSTKLSSKGNTFLNLDRSFPNQIFTATIFKKSLLQFTYEPHIELKDKAVCVTGKITEYNGTPSMIIQGQEKVKILDIK